jgi:phage N-6-adenine-methyltransferase
MALAREPVDRPALRRGRRGVGGHQAAAYVTDVWLTPPGVLALLGPFDLDPCAADEPRPWPTAARHFTRTDDGLSREWSGRVWCNPPYGPHIGKWLERLARHGNGIALVFARTETRAWFDWVWPAADTVCFVRGRLNFHGPDGIRSLKNCGAPVALVAYGQENADVLGRSGLGQCVVLEDLS